MLGALEDSFTEELTLPAPMEPTRVTEHSTSGQDNSVIGRYVCGRKPAVRMEVDVVTRETSDEENDDGADR